jgi:hypothetical protein
VIKLSPKVQPDLELLVSHSSPRPSPLNTTPVKMQFTILASLAMLAVGVSAGEGIHLANCYINSQLGDVPYSKMVYYPDDAQANQGVVPSTNNQCAVNTPGQGGFKVWEGSAITCNFPSNTFFTSNLQSGAGGYSVGQYAG